LDRIVPILTAAVLGASMIHPASPAGSSDSDGRLTLARVAHYPPPGTRVPGSFAFTHDGRFLYFLNSEEGGTVRSLFREEVATGQRERIAGPPSGKSPGEALSREEVLRRERRRIEEKGITQYVVAEKADVVAFAYEGDLYLARPAADPLRLTDTPAEEIDPQLSPDGGRLAFVRDGDLVVMDLASRRESRLTRGAREGLSHGLAEYIAQEEMDRPTGFWWSPDGARIAFTEVDESGIPTYPIVHQGGAAWEVENHRYPFAGGPNARVRLGIVPAAGGDPLWLELFPASQDFYLARVAWERNSASLLAEVQSRDQKLLSLVRFDAVSGRATTLLEEHSETWIDLHDDLRPLEDGRFLWSGESSGFRHLELRAGNGSLVRALTSGRWPVDSLEGVDEKGGFAYFSAAIDSPLHRLLYRVPLQGGAIENVAIEPGSHRSKISPDGRFLVDVHDSAAIPPRVFLKDGAGKEIRVLAANQDPEPKALGLRAPEFITLRASDGTILHGAILKPAPLAPGRRYPAIVRVYGGPTAQEVRDSWDLTRDLRAQYLAQHGYVVLRLDNRGSMGRGHAFTAALFHHLGSVEVEDQKAGARYLASLPFVDGSRIGIYGWSYGGYVAARCLLLAPDLFRAAVVGAPVTDWDGYDTHYTERYMGTPRENPDGYRDSSLLPLASRLRGDLLIVHGMADENVHFRHTARLLNALNAAQKRYDLLVFPDERHLPRGEEDRRWLEERVVGHFDRALKSPPQKRGAASLSGGGP
jgi:dipeptidyl-peptidase 4